MLTEVSQRQAAFRISGAQAPAILASAISLVDGLRPGRCGRTKFAEEADVFVQQLADADYRLLIDVGLSRYAADWLREAAELTQ